MWDAPASPGQAQEPGPGRRRAPASSQGSLWNVGGAPTRVRGEPIEDVDVEAAVADGIADAPRDAERSVSARLKSTVIDSPGPGPPPLVDERQALEQAIAATERELVDRRRLEKVAAGYPEFKGRLGALLIAIAALAWERGQPLRLRTQPADIARLDLLLALALRGASVGGALGVEEGSRQ
jgi:hypothetical protein